MEWHGTAWDACYLPPSPTGLLPWHAHEGIRRRASLAHSRLGAVRLGPHAMTSDSAQYNLANALPSSKEGAPSPNFRCDASVDSVSRTQGYSTLTLVFRFHSDPDCHPSPVGAACPPRSSLACPSTSPALFYLRDTRLFGPCTNTTPGVVPMTTSSSPLGATNRPKDTPAAGTV